MQNNTFLFLALTRAGWGETELGIRIAYELREGGHECHFLAHESNQLLLDSTPFTSDYISDATACLFSAYLDEHISLHKPHSIILCDLLTTQRWFNWLRLSPSTLTKYDIPIFSIDTWDHEITGSKIDMFLGESVQISTNLDQISHKLTPVPIAEPRPNGNFFQCLPNITPNTSRPNDVRFKLGLKPEDKIILFCTAAWQHLFYCEDGKKLAALVPELLANYVSTLPNEVHFVHVGPAPYDIKPLLGNRYIWIKSLPSDKFQDLLSITDLQLAANISATTITKSIINQVPIIVIENPATARELDDIRDIYDKSSYMLKQWINKAFPIYPYHLWPLGYYKYLKPILTETNTYANSITRIEMMDESSFIQKCNQILFCRESRSHTIDIQNNALNNIKSLPKVSEIIANTLATV